MVKSTCVICCKPERLQIDREIVQGANYASLAKKHGVSYNSMYNHACNHLSRQMVQAARQKDLMASMDIIGDVEDLIQRTKRILDEVEAKKRHGTALQAIRELRGHYELLSKIAFALHQARLAELEQSQLNAEFDEEQAQQAAMKRLRVLSLDELKLYHALTDKLDKQERGLPIEIPRPIEFKRKPARKKQPEPEPEPEAETIDTTEYFHKKPVRVFRATK